MTLTRILPARAAAGLGAAGAALLLCLTMTAAQAQSWTTRTVSGNGAALIVNAGGTATAIAAATMPDPSGGQASADTNAVAVPGSASAGVASAVTAGMGSLDGTGSSQTVSAAANVNVLNGLITADRVIAVASVETNGNKLMADGDGSSVTNLVVNGTSMGGGADFVPAPNTRVNLPNGAYVILNEQVQTGHGAQGLTITVNMIHVYTASGDVIVGSSSSTVS